MNQSRRFAFLVLAGLMLSLCINISLGAPKRNILEKASAKATKLQRKAAVSDIKVDKLPYCEMNFIEKKPLWQAVRRILPLIRGPY